MVEDLVSNNRCAAPALVEYQRLMAATPSSLPRHVAVRLQQAVQEALQRPFSSIPAKSLELAAYLNVQWERGVRRCNLAPEDVRLDDLKLEQLILLLDITLDAVEQARSGHDPTWPDSVFVWAIDQLVGQEGPEADCARCAEQVKGSPA